MAISATFSADYTQFIGPTKVAGTELTKLTGKTDAQAAAMARLNQSSEQGAASHGRLTQQFHQFDGVLASMGIHIRPEIDGLSDLADASGKSAKQMGLLGTAGLVFGAAAAGWKVGRLVSDFFGLDQAIGSATAKLLGWGDAVGEAAGAKQDTLNKASKEAGRLITDYSEAIRINSKAWEDHNLVMADTLEVEKRANAAMAQLSKDVEHDMAAAAAEAQKFQEALGALAAVGTNWQTTLEALDGETVNAIRYYTAAGVSQADLATAYGLTAGQIRAVVSALGDEKVAIEAAAAAEKARAAANAKIQEERAAIQPTSKYSHPITYGGNPATAYADIAPLNSGGMTNAAGQAITSITQDINPAVGPPRSSAGSMTITINAAGLTTAEITRQIEAELVKSAKLKGLVGGTH